MFVSLCDLVAVDFVLLILSAIDTDAVDRFLFYAQVHRNAFLTTMNLLKQNLCVEEFESNLATITHLSQQRHDSIYRADARKVLSLCVLLGYACRSSYVGSYSCYNMM